MKGLWTAQTCLERLLSRLDTACELPGSLPADGRRPCPLALRLQVLDVLHPGRANVSKVRWPGPRGGSMWGRRHGGSGSRATAVPWLQTRVSLDLSAALAQVEQKHRRAGSAQHAVRAAAALGAEQQTAKPALGKSSRGQPGGPCSMTSCQSAVTSVNCMVQHLHPVAASQRRQGGLLPSARPGAPSAALAAPAGTPSHSPLLPGPPLLPLVLPRRPSCARSWPRCTM